VDLLCDFSAIKRRGTHLEVYDDLNIAKLLLQSHQK
jgi:hypothetical protein